MAGITRKGTSRLKVRTGKRAERIISSGMQVGMSGFGRLRRIFPLLLSLTETGNHS
ncbi:MAG: hypothetical protein HYY68_01390 [Thaumarchaeota archaeon]|nr:hypothetical protein [Nitrososphaerota archaeon]